MQNGKKQHPQKQPKREQLLQSNQEKMPGSYFIALILLHLQLGQNIVCGLLVHRINWEFSLWIMGSNIPVEGLLASSISILYYY